MASRYSVLRNGKKYRTNMTPLEFLEYSKTREHPERVAGYYQPKRDENGDPVRHYNGSAAAVKSLRAGFQQLLELTDCRFTARLMKTATGVYQMDSEGEPYKKSIYFSREKEFLKNLRFNVRESRIEMFIQMINHEHVEDRNEATLIAKDFKIKPVYIPGGVTHFRILHHLSIVSDFVFSEFHKCFVAVSKLNELSVIGYSQYFHVSSAIDDEIKVSFPEGTVLSEDDTVIQCFGVEFYEMWANSLQKTRGGGVMVVDVF